MGMKDGIPGEFCRRKRLIAAYAMLGLSLALAAALLAGCGSAANKSAQEMSSSLAVAPRVEQGAAGAASSAAGKPMADTALSVRDQYGAAAKSVAPTAGAAQAVGEAAPAAATAPLPPTTSAGIAPGAPDAAADGYNRKLIYKANLTMQVDDYAKTQTQIRDLVQLSGGYILQFSEAQSQYEQGGNFTIKVPAAGFTSFIDGLEQMKPVKLQRSIQGQDVSEEYVDLMSRLKAKQTVEARLLDFMDKATASKDLLAFSDQLAKVQEEIEQIKGRMRYLDQNVAYSTIDLRVYQSKPGLSGTDTNSPSLWEKAGRAVKGTLSLLSSAFAGFVVFLAAAFPLAVLLAIIAVPTIYYVRKRRRQVKLEARRKLQEFEQNSHLSEPSTDRVEDQTTDPQGQ